MEQCAKIGWELPDSIQNAPELNQGLELYLGAFFDLQASRQLGMSAGPIWWDTIQNYCDRNGLDVEQTEAMHHHIQAMDTVYLKHLQKKS